LPWQSHHLGPPHSLGMQPLRTSRRCADPGSLGGTGTLFCWGAR
jgi:hypothetical protein